MKRAQAVLFGLLVAAFAPYAHADALSQHGCAAEIKAIGPGSATVTVAHGESAGEYRTSDSTESEGGPGAAEPSGEMKEAAPPAASTPGEPGHADIESRNPMETGNIPESVTPEDESKGGDVPSEPTPKSY